MKSAHTIYIMMETEYYYPEAINRIVFWNYTHKNDNLQKPFYSDSDPVSMNEACCTIVDVIKKIDKKCSVNIKYGAPPGFKFPFFTISKIENNNISSGIRYTLLTESEQKDLDKLIQKRMSNLHERNYRQKDHFN